MAPPPGPPPGPPPLGSVAGSGAPGPATGSPTRLSWTWIAIVVVLLAGPIVWVVSQQGPDDVVEEFFEAVIDKDVDHALSLVTRIGLGVPYGEHAAFIHPDAIADGWELVSATESAKPGKYSTDIWVDVELSDGAETVQGRIEVEERDGDWMLVDPFVTVNVESSPFDYLQVNGMSLTLDELHAQNVAGLFHNQYKLLPGPYEFFGSAAGVATDPEPAEFLFREEGSSYYDGDYQLTVPSLEVTEEARQAAQESFDTLLGDCLAFEVRQPPNCPFGIDKYHGSAGYYADDAGDITWSVSEYPEVRLVDPGSPDREAGMNIELDSTAVIELTATAEIDREWTDISATCDIDVEKLRAALTVDGVDVYFMDTFALGGFLSFPQDTCELTDVNGVDDES